MSRTNTHWLHRFTVLTALVTLGLLCIGGLVTSHGVGMAVPDWPNTYGYNMFAFPFSQWLGGVFYEHSHRLVASLVGLLTTVLAVWFWVRETQGRNRWLGVSAMVLVILLMGVRQMPVYLTLASVAPVVIVWSFWRQRQAGGLRWLGVAALAAVILQGVLGGLRVVWLKDEIGIFHATLAQLFFVLICFLMVSTSGRWTLWSAAGAEKNVPGLRGMALAATVLILGQLAVGATMRHQHAGLAIPDFPLAYGKVWPAMDADAVMLYNQQRLEVVAAKPITAFQIGLQLAHRAVALGILFMVSAVAWQAHNRLAAGSPLRRLAWAWFGLIGAQVGLGAYVIWSNKAADVATAHVLVGALSLVTGALWCLIAFRRFAVRTERETVLRTAAATETGFEAHPATVAGK